MKTQDLMDRVADRTTWLITRAFSGGKVAVLGVRNVPPGVTGRKILALVGLRSPAYAALPRWKAGRSTVRALTVRSVDWTELGPESRELIDY